MQDLSPLLRTRQNVPRWHFWNPGSGLLGGMLFAVVMSGLSFGIAFGLTTN